MKEKAKEWIKAAGVRAIKTMAQTMLATLGTTAAFTEVDWLVIASTAGFAGFLSILTSLAGLPELKFNKETEETSEVQ